MSETPQKKDSSQSTPLSLATDTKVPNSIADRLKATWANLTTSQKIAGVLTTLITFGGLLWIALSASHGDYQTLYSGLSAKQSSQITQALKENNIPYELDGDSTINVPSDMVHEARVQLAGQGLPSEGSGTGFELFDKNEFGMTAFTQKVNYQRAMEAELARTIRHLQAVRQARVHLVIPERSLFKDDARQPTASVILGLNPGTQLDESAIRSIRHMVASSVEGLDARDITLVDESGDLLAAPRQEGALGGFAGAGGGEEAQRTAQGMEQQLEQRVMALLAPIVGPRGARVEASVELDSRVVQETSESYDPEKTAVRREQRTEEQRQNSEAEAGGIAGAAAQLTGTNDAEGANSGNQSTRSSEAAEYEIDKTVRQITETGPRVSRLSIAVLLDENVLAPPAKEGEEAAPAPDLTKISALVAGAVGLKEARGDRLELSMQPFQPAEAHELAEIPFYQEPAFIQSSIRHAVLALVALLLILFVARPLVSSFTQAIKVSEEEKKAKLALAAEAPQQTRTLQEPELVGRSVAEIIDEVEDGVTLELSSIDPVFEHQKLLRAEVLELSSSDLDRTSQVVSQWLRMDDDITSKNKAS